MEGIVSVSRVEDPQNIDFPKVKGQLTLGRYTSILGPQPSLDYTHYLGRPHLNEAAPPAGSPGLVYHIPPVSPGDSAPEYMQQHDDTGAEAQGPEMLPRVRHCTHAGNQMLPGQPCIKPPLHVFQNAGACPLSHVHHANTHVRKRDAFNYWGSQVSSKTP